MRDGYGSKSSSPSRTYPVNEAFTRSVHHDQISTNSDGHDFDSVLGDSLIWRHDTRIQNQCYRLTNGNDSWIANRDDSWVTNRDDS